MTQQAAYQPLRNRALDPLVDQVAPDIDKRAVLHARRTGGFAVPACQATIQMFLCGFRRLNALEHLLDQVDTATRTIALVAQYLIGGTGCQAEAAMDATAQDFVGVLTQIGITRPRS